MLLFYSLLWWCSNAILANFCIVIGCYLVIIGTAKRRTVPIVNAIHLRKLLKITMHIRKSI